jgi:hypothetical protein
MLSTLSTNERGHLLLFKYRAGPHRHTRFMYGRVQPRLQEDRRRMPKTQRAVCPARQRRTWRRGQEALHAVCQAHLVATQRAASGDRWFGRLKQDRENPEKVDQSQRNAQCRNPIQQSKHYLGIRYDPRLLSSSVARTAPFAVASLLK